MHVCKKLVWQHACINVTELLITSWQNVLLLGCSLYLKSGLNFKGIKSWLLFTELGRIVVESLFFYLGNNGPRPTHLRGKAMILMVFFGFSVILCYILPSILIIYRIGQKFLPHNSWYCLEISVASIDFGVTMTNFAFTP